MKKRFMLMLLAMALDISAWADGTFRGRVTDENGEPMIGATIVIKSLPTVGTTADYDGKFSLKVPSGQPVVVMITFIGYLSQEETINLNDNEVLVRDYALQPESKTLEDVVVVAKAKKANDTYMQLIKNKSAVSIDYISSETMRRTGDSHATDAIKRITGVSTIGGFVSVRGLADRYIKTAVNGMRIPTLDPITNNIKLDIFPTSLVDNIVITKTISPDIPSDWAGSYVSIETKDYPDKLSINFSTTLGYNEHSSFQEILGSKRSQTDWLGYDNGYRDIYRAGYKGSYPIYIESNRLLPYHEFVALGLGDFIQSNGLSTQTLGIESRNNLDYYYRLCLVELGLLAPGYIDNLEEVELANLYYENEYRQDAILMARESAVDFGQTLPNNWGTIKRSAPLSFSQELSIGNQFNLFGRPLGFIMGLRYASSLRRDPGAKGGLARANEDGTDDYLDSYRDYEFTTENNGWSALVNLAYSFSPNHNISVMFMPNLNGINYARSGYNWDYDAPASDTLYYFVSQYYEERKQLVYQAHSNHFFPGIKLKVDVDLSYTNGSSGIPDSKNLKVFPQGDRFLYRSSDYEYKKSTYLFEDVLDINLAAELPIFSNPGLVRKIKFGAAFQNNDREVESYRFYLNSPGTDILFDDVSEINDLLNKQNFSYDSEEGRFFYYRYEKDDRSFVIGNSKISAGYAMIDYAFNEAIRLSGGLRLEYTDVFTDVKLYHELNLPANHPLRLEATSGGGTKLPAAVPGKLVRYNYLPSANLVWKLIENENIRLNSRFNFSQSIARPSIREITPLYQEDFILQRDILGNPKLKIVEIDNYDLRVESFFPNGDNASVSLFYKKFRNHIELVEVPYTTWANAQIAEAYGIEVEGQKFITKNLDLRANITIVESFAKIDLEQGVLTHPMFGQAPYIINAIMGYTSDRLGFSASLSYNVQGRKLSIITLKSNITENSDIYEMPQHLVDVKFAKNLGKHFVISLRARNLLNSPYRRSYDYERVGIIDHERITYGTDYLLSISYSL